MRLIILIMCFAFRSVAETLYLEDGATGANNGSSWTDAWNASTNVVWGSGAGQLGSGDTLYVGAGSYSTFTVGDSGTLASFITIRAAQDTHTGVANLGAISMAGKDYVSFVGSYNGATNFVFTSLSAQDSNNSKWSFFKITNSSMDIRYSGSNEMSYFLAVLPEGTPPETTLYGTASLNTDAYDQTLIHNGHVLIVGQINNGNGPDGIHSGKGFTYSNMVFQSFQGTYTGGQHQDSVQCYGDRWIKFIGCEFIDSGDSMLDWSSSGNSVIEHLWAINCVFRRTIDAMGTVMLRIYTDSGTISGFNDIRIDNNTFVDGARTGSSYGAAMRFQTGNGATTNLNCSVANNIIYNCGDTWPAILIESVSDNWSFQYNLINAGSQGNTTTTGWTQDAGAQTGAPTFESYTAYAMANDYRLDAADTVATGNGENLSAYFTKDKAGATRTVPWDIGAYKSGGGGEDPPADPPATVKTYVGKLIQY